MNKDETDSRIVVLAAAKLAVHQSSRSTGKLLQQAEKIPKPYLQIGRNDELASNWPHIPPAPAAALVFWSKRGLLDRARDENKALDRSWPSVGRAAFLIFLA